MIPLEHNVPAPDSTRYKDPSIRDALKLLAIGQSFVVPVRRRKNLSYQCWWLVQDSEYGAHHFTFRTFTDEQGEKQVRCWRVEDWPEGMHTHDLRQALKKKGNA